MPKKLKLPEGFPPNLAVKIVQKKNFRHLKMRFDSDSCLVINLPRYVNQGVCEEFIRTNLKWILTHFEKYKQNKESIKWNQFYLFGQWVTFDALKPYLDKTLESRLRKTLQQDFEKNSALLVQELWQAVVQDEQEKNVTQSLDLKSKAKLKSLLAILYQRALESYVAPRVEEISQIMQLFPRQIGYGKSYRQLGCCKTKNQAIRLSLRLALMPYCCIDSVIIHELAHLRYPHHQRDFWNLVRAFDSNPKGVESWLSANSYLNAQLYRRIFK